MSELKIPEQATTCFWESTSEVDMDPSDWDVMKDGLALAARIIVAAELCRLLHQPETMRRGEVGRSALFRQLRTRANELDPEGATQ